MDPTTTTTRVLGVGSLGFAAWGLLAPASLGRYMGLSPTAGRWIGARELVVGSAMLARPGPVTLAMRTASDAMDTALTATHGKRGVATGSASFGALALGTAIAAIRR
jgi:hypothetical protein